MMSDPHRLGPGFAATPFSPDEIRTGCPAGREIRLSVREPGASYTRVIRFIAVDAEGAVQESRAMTADGAALGEPAVSRTTWVELQRHAAFPAESTTMAAETLASPLGRLECRVYEVDEGSSVTRFWFAMNRPGMPVRMETRVGDQVTYLMEMVGDSVR